MRRNLPSLQALTSFEVVAQTGSFTQAAEQLSLTQGAVSHQIIGLEKHLGVVLFHRRPRRLELTEVGQRLLASIGPALDSIEGTVHDLIASKGAGGTLELAVVPSFAAKWLIPRLPDFHRQHPAITLNLLTRLIAFSNATVPVDATIHYGKPDWPGAECEYLMGEDIVVVCSAALHDSGALREPADVLGYTRIHQPHSPHAWRDWLALAGVDDVHAASVGPRYGLFNMVTQAVKAGLGLAALPRFLIEDELADGSLRMPFELTLRSDAAYYFVTPTARLAYRPRVLFRNWLLGQAQG